MRTLYFPIFIVALLISSCATPTDQELMSENTRSSVAKDSRGDSAEQQSSHREYVPAVGTLPL
ncbi:MAG: hypothetical protein OCD01_09890 [Fibrobacterales bacterium]